ncbi:hypothetical protein P171DRAFT_486842 [Karstenula rhodostoma CBS 690.94]|uniref:Uncharacterized protein n=1 Tax=Karstenula rhodostoma CBS 690.94 TaxID=1392251 RepID=A0A9P4PGE8_9PLEO|nr:hypothetical protein P171DRAFT_486842 [Karstenula rhodostoma CBS 690.94]
MLGSRNAGDQGRIARGAGGTRRSAATAMIRCTGTGGAGAGSRGSESLFPASNGRSFVAAGVGSAPPQNRSKSKDKLQGPPRCISLGQVAFTSRRSSLVARCTRCPHPPPTPRPSPEQQPRHAFEARDRGAAAPIGVEQLRPLRTATTTTTARLKTREPRTGLLQLPPVHQLQTD